VSGPSAWTPSLFSAIVTCSRSSSGHYLTECHHQGIGSQIIWPRESPSNDNATLGALGCRSRLGGLPNYYGPKAA
jgi:hypothetical protein